MTKKLRRAAVAERGVRNACISERKREETDICEAKGTEQRSCEVTKLGESESMVKMIDCLVNMYVVLKIR
ncbi:hypothetical protein DWW86_13535 [Ruminococcus sp. AF17-22AC]|nr:hypothetical protein DWW86_13535 [Ruminococcus sp. AF17-22AC]